MLPAIAAAARAARSARLLKRARVNAKLAKRKLIPVARGAKKLAPVGRRIMNAGAGGGVMMNAGAGVAGAAAFGAASSITGRLTKNLGTGLPLIAFALLVDLIALEFILKGNPYHLAMHAIVGVLMYGFIMKRDNVVLGIVFLNFLPLITSRIPASDFTVVIANTIGNPFIPWWFIYAGFIRNRREGKIAGIIFWAFVLVFLAIGYKVGGAQIAEAANIELTQDQIATAEAAKGGIITAVKTIGKDAFNGIKGIPGTITKAFISFTGTEILFDDGTSKEEPKLGIVIIPDDPAKEGDKIIAQATLRILEPLPQGNFLTISDISCWREKKLSGKDSGNITLRGGTNFEEGINIYYNYPQTVYCEFTKEQLEGASTVKIAVQYHVNANGQFKTYFIKDELREELLISGENPAAYMKLKGSQLTPVIKYDNTPASFGIGPKELGNPPIGIADGEFGRFAISIGNRRVFQGKIAKINTLQVTLPDGIEFVGESCMFQKGEEGNSYFANPEQAENSESFYDIESKRVFTCRMNVSSASEALKHSEAIFNVHLDFTYETETQLSVKVQ